MPQRKLKPLYLSDATVRLSAAQRAVLDLLAHGGSLTTSWHQAKPDDAPPPRYVQAQIRANAVIVQKLLALGLLERLEEGRVKLTPRGKEAQATMHPTLAKKEEATEAQEVTP